MAAVVDETVTIDVSTVVLEEEEIFLGLSPLQILLVGGGVAVAALAAFLTFR